MRHLTDILSYRFGSLNMIPDVTPNGVFYLPPTGWLTSFYNPPKTYNLLQQYLPYIDYLKFNIHSFNKSATRLTFFGIFIFSPVISVMVLVELAIAELLIILLNSKKIAKSFNNFFIIVSSILFIPEMSI